MLQKTERHDLNQSAIDIAMMERCIRLSAAATQRGEFPFAALVCRDGAVIAQATNEVGQSKDVTRHAELLAISEAQRTLKRKDLSDCSLYSNVEPCVMCSFPVRETRISRVVFAISSPMMGGFSKWNVLRDAELSSAMPEAFGPMPEVISGLLRREAERVWWSWNPLIWSIIRYRGCFGPEGRDTSCIRLEPERRGRLRQFFMARYLGRSR